MSGDWGSSGHSIADYLSVFYFFLCIIFPKLIIDRSCRGFSVCRLSKVLMFLTSSNRYSAIDMSTFEALKLTYLRSTGLDEPGVLALLAFGSVSGSVGAISVYPLNLVRTRLQASGSPGHPQRYAGVWDVVQKTYQRDGWRGFYRGLFPTLAKVSIAWYLEETHGSLILIYRLFLQCQSLT